MNNLSFINATRRKTIPLASQSKGVTSPLQWELPKTGLLAGIYLQITGSIAGTLSAPNALGMASIVRRVRLYANSGIDLFNLSGAQYHYLMRKFLEDYKDPVPASNAYDAVTATTFDVSFWIPISLNARDPLGLFMLQNEQTLLQLEVEFESDSVVATGATVTATAQPMLEIMTVPVDPASWPPLNVIQQIVGESSAIAAAGEYSYRWPRGNTYVQVIHGIGIGATGADSWSEARMRVNQSDNVYRWTPALYDMEYERFHGAARELGVMAFDLIGSSGLGNYGNVRDLFNSALVTDLETVITATGAVTLYTVRRQLVALAG